MAVYEKNALLTSKDNAGNKHLIYPITRIDCVDGAEDVLHYGAAQELTDDEQAQVRTNIGALPTADSAKIGQLIRVAAVDAKGKIAAVETVDATPSGSASVNGETLVLSGSISGATVSNESLILS